LFSLQVTLPSGDPYLNNGQCWPTLAAAGKQVRYLGMLPVDDITDARNSTGRRHVRPEDADREPWVHPAETPAWYLPAVAVSALHPGGALGLPWFTVGGYGYDPSDEPVLLSVWCEKSTMDDILVPLCRSLHVNYLSGTGYESIPAAVAMLRRADDYPSRRLHVLYISDHDPVTC
jgi:hypothetical protein